MDETLVFEKGDHIYLVAPVAPFEPADQEVEELAFSSEVLQMAPNKMLGWLRGQYVEADRPNENGALWTAQEIAVQSLTPMLMPVTVMHDPRTAVGMIADTRLLTPAANEVPRARIDTTLGIWRHRFPDTWEEVAHNYKSGSLMQSMECLPAYYDCSVCEKRFPKLPGGAEKAQWCAHLRGEENAKAARRLGNVTFTGTGLIFGSRGARGAFDAAHLEVFQEEVAEFHERVHTDSRRKPKPRRQRQMEIEDSRYQELLAAESERNSLKEKAGKLEETAAKVPDLEKTLETTEAAKTKAETELAAEKKKREDLEEAARSETLAKDRLEKLGKGFTGKLGDFTKGRLDEQAKTLSDEEWDNRLKELEETAGVKRDDGSENDGNGNGNDTVSREETARSQTASTRSNGGNGQEPSAAARRSVVAGLVPKAGS